MASQTRILNGIPGQLASDHCRRQAWCVKSHGHDEQCESQFLGIPSSDLGPCPDVSPHKVLQAVIEYDEDSGRPQITFDAGGDDWVGLNADQLRAYTAKVRDHCIRLDAMADQYEAITAPREPEPCFSWCASHSVDTHDGPRLHLPVPDGLDVDHDELLSARVCIDYGVVDPRPLISFCSGGNGTLLDGQEADKAIADLEQFLTDLKVMRAQLDEGPVA